MPNGPRSVSLRRTEGLNPAVLIDGHAWPQWDVWPVPFVVFALLAASCGRWLVAGMLTPQTFRSNLVRDRGDGRRGSTPLPKVGKPAVTHADGTARVQTVAREQNPLFYDLIESFGKLTGVAVLVKGSRVARLESVAAALAGQEP